MCYLLLKRHRRRGHLLDVVVPLHSMRCVRAMSSTSVRRVFEEGAAPLAERLRIHNRMRIRPVGLRRDLLRVEPGALVLVRVLPAFPRVVPRVTARLQSSMNIAWDPEASAAALRAIVAELEDLCRVMRQVYGATHPGFRMCQNYLTCARGRLAGQPCMTKRGDTYTLIPAVRE